MTRSSTVVNVPIGASAATKLALAASALPRFPSHPKPGANAVCKAYTDRLASETCKMVAGAGRCCLENKDRCAATCCAFRCFFLLTDDPAFPLNATGYDPGWMRGVGWHGRPTPMRDSQGKEMPHIYSNDMYILHREWDTRLHSSRLRTHNPEHADVFFLPSVFAIRSEESAALVAYLEQSKWFQRRHGLDHAVVLSRNAEGGYRKADSVYRNPAKFTSNPSPFYNILKLTHAPYLHPNSWADPVGTGTTSTVGVPPVSLIQHNLNADPAGSDRPWCRSNPASEDRVLATFIGSELNHAPARSAAIAECAARNGSGCNLVIASGNRNVNLSELSASYQTSTFCLSPPGDNPDRRGMWDAMLLGCIPVLFDRITMDMDYPWFLPCPRDMSVLFLLDDSSRDAGWQTEATTGDEKLDELRGWAATNGGNADTLCSLPSLERWLYKREHQNSADADTVEDFWRLTNCSGWNCTCKGMRRVFLTRRGCHHPEKRDLCGSRKGWGRVPRQAAIWWTANSCNDDRMWDEPPPRNSPWSLPEPPHRVYAWPAPDRRQPGGIIDELARLVRETPAAVARMRRSLCEAGHALQYRRSDPGQECDFWQCTCQGFCKLYGLDPKDVDLAKMSKHHRQFWIEYGCGTRDMAAKVSIRVANHTRCGVLDWLGVYPKTAEGCRIIVQKQPASECSHRYFVWAEHGDNNCACAPANASCTVPGPEVRQARVSALYRIVSTKSAETRLPEVGGDTSSVTPDAFDIGLARVFDLTQKI